MRRAFTLLELLIVIAIVGMLIAILIPALGAARRAAHATVCQSNLRTHHTGFKAYQDANNGVMPFTRFPFRPKLDLLTPVKEIAEHLDAPMPRLEGDAIVTGRPWVCPADRQGATEWGWSYMYWPEPLFSYYEMDGNPAGKVTTMYDADPTSTLFADAYPGHARASTVKPGNYEHATFLVRYDGSVERASERGYSVR